jgi:hypothetical protein
MRNCIKFWLENLKGKGYLGDPVGEITPKWILEKQDVKKHTV